MSMSADLVQCRRLRRPAPAARVEDADDYREWDAPPQEEGGDQVAVEYVQKGDALFDGQRLGRDLAWCRRKWSHTILQIKPG